MLLGACANPVPFVQPSAAPKVAIGYVGGLFISSPSNEIAGLVLTSTENGDQFTVAFASKAPKAERHSEIGMIEVPEGSYVITHWIVFAGLGKELLMKNDLKSGPLARKVEVGSDSIGFFG